MIRKIYSSLSTFKSLDFRPGLNILLTDKSPEATRLQTRNRAGKSSFVEIVHFLCGSSCDKESIFRTAALVNSTFGMEFDIKGRNLTVSRTGCSASGVASYDKATGQCATDADWDKRNKQYVIPMARWKAFLGKEMFGLPNLSEGKQPAGYPPFRSLFSYFARRQAEGGFMSPSQYWGNQSKGDEQISISFLLGLDWGIPAEWERIRDNERTLRELKKAAGKGALGQVIGSSADIRTQLTVAEDRARRIAENLKIFQVHPEYRNFEIEAAELTRKISRLSNENTLDRELVMELEKSLQDEIAPSITDLQKLYSEAGVVIPNTALQRFDEVEAFHNSVVSNRKSYLQNEAQEASERISKRDRSIRQFSDRLSVVMNILKTHNALEQFIELQRELTRVETEVETLRQKYQAAEQMEGQKTQADLDRNRLLLRLKQDYTEQDETLRTAIIAFENISSALYEEAGSLTINPTRNGPEIAVKIQGQRSKGISNMQIFCFDMMLMELCCNRGIGTGFLIHDSHLFDGVDARQVATALKIGADLAEKLGFQYIVTMNSDTVPDGFDIENYVLPVKLTDATEEGGLFGIRF